MEADNEELRKILSLFQATEISPDHFPHWNEAMKTYPVDGQVYFLTPKYIENACREMHFSDEIRDGLIAGLNLFINHPPLAKLLWYYRYFLFQTDTALSEKKAAASAWPELPDSADFHAPLFYAWLFLGGWESLSAAHRRAGIPEDITIDTVSDLALWMNDYRMKNGKWGFKQKSWLLSHYLGALFKIGRLQFNCETFKSDFHAFRHLNNGKILLLAGDKIKFRRDGQWDCASGIADTNAWISEYVRDGNILRGHPVPPSGAAVAELHNYAAEEWEPILEKGDPVLGVHIPAAGKLDHGECGDSFKRALVFFPAHVPEYPFKAFHCDSWLLDNQFENILPDNSNIRKFLMEFYLYPVQGASSAQLFERVFNCKPRDADSLPINNSLQQALVAHLKQGGHFHNGGGIIFPRDMRWGTSTHR